MNLDMNKLYRRNTHINGKFREDKRNNWEGIDNRGIIHYLHPDKHMNIADVCSEIFKYASDFPFEHDASLACNPVALQVMLKELAKSDIITITENHDKHD